MLTSNAFVEEADLANEGLTMILIDWRYCYRDKMNLQQNQMQKLWEKGHLLWSHHLQKADHPLPLKEGHRKDYIRNVIHICTKNNFKRKKPLQK